MGVGGWFACNTDRHISHAQGSVSIRGLRLPAVGCQWHLLFRNTIDYTSPLLFREISGLMAVSGEEQGERWFVSSM